MVWSPQVVTGDASGHDGAVAAKLPLAAVEDGRADGRRIGRRIVIKHLGAAVVVDVGGVASVGAFHHSIRCERSHDILHVSSCPRHNGRVQCRRDQLSGSDGNIAYIYYCQGSQIFPGILRIPC